jgi:hypothetical protein
MYYGPDGRRYTAATTFASKAEARAWLALRQADIIRKAWQPPEAVSRPGRRTFGACVEQWMTHRQLKDRTRAHYRWLLDEHLIPAFGSRPLASITSDEVRSWFTRFGAAKSTVGRTATGCCAASWAALPATGRSA